MEPVPQPDINIVATIEETSRVIGNNGSFIWHLRSAVERLKSLTADVPVIMGSRTAHATGGLFAAHRKMLVVSSRMPRCGNGIVCRSFYDALYYARASWKNAQIFVAGGEGLFREALPYANMLYLTVVSDPKVRGDRFFPNFKKEDYDRVEWQEWGEGYLSFRFETLRRKTAP